MTRHNENFDDAPIPRIRSLQPVAKGGIVDTTQLYQGRVKYRIVPCVY